MPSPAHIRSGCVDLGPASTRDLNRLPNPGSAFDADTGKLFQFRRDGKDSEYARIEVVRLWPDPRCWKKSLKQLPSGAVETKGWQGGAPDLALQFLYDLGPKTLEESLRKQARWTANFNQALLRVPDELREAVCRFAPQHHWRVLNLLARAPGFLERVEAQPLVVLSVAYANYFKSASVCRPYRSARALQTKRSADILRWLDWPTPKSSLKLLRRLDPSVVQVSDLYRLRQLAERGERWLRHLPRLNPSALLLLDYHRNLVCFRLVEQAATTLEAREQRWVVRAVRRLRRWVARGPEGRRVPRVRDSQHLQQLSLALVRRRRLAEQGQLPAARRKPPSIEVPPPPFENSVDITTGPLVLRPLTSGQELFEHSRRMGNCLAFSPAYLQAIESGQGVAYELHWAGEGKRPSLTATAYFARNEEGRWALQELALPYNAEAPDWLTHKVWGWLSARAPTAPPGAAPLQPALAPPEPNALWLPF